MAEKTLSAVLVGNPSYRMAFEDLIKLYFENKQIENMHQLMQTWLQFNSDDHRVREMLGELEKSIHPKVQINRLGQ